MALHKLRMKPLSVISFCLLGLIQGCAASSTKPPLPLPLPPRALTPLPIPTDPGGLPPIASPFLFIDGLSVKKLDGALRAYFKPKSWSIEVGGHPKQWWFTMKRQGGTVTVYACDQFARHNFCLDLGGDTPAGAHIEADYKTLEIILKMHGAKVEIKCFYTITHECVDSLAHAIQQEL